MPKPRISGNLFPATGEGSGNAVRAILESGRATAAGITGAAEGVARGIINKKQYERGKEEAAKDRAFRESEAEKGRAASMEREKFSQDRQDARARARMVFDHNAKLSALARKNQEEVAGWDAMAKQMEANGLDPSPAIQKRDAAKNKAGAVLSQMMNGAEGKYDPAGIADMTPQMFAARAAQRAGAENAKKFIINDISAAKRKPATTAEAMERKNAVIKKGMDMLRKVDDKLSGLNLRDEQATKTIEARAQYLKEQVAIKKNMTLFEPIAKFMRGKGLMDDSGYAAGSMFINGGGTWKDAVKNFESQVTQEGRMTPEIRDAFLSLSAAQSRKEVDAALSKLKSLDAEPKEVVDKASTAYGRVGVITRNQQALDAAAKKAEIGDLTKIGAAVEKAMYSPAKKGQDPELRDPVATAMRLLPTMHREDTVKFLMSGEATPQQRTALLYLVRMQLGEEYATSDMTPDEINDRVESELKEIMALVKKKYGE